MELNAALVQAMTTRQSCMVQRLLQAGAAVPHHDQRYPLLFIALDLKEFTSFQMLLNHTPELVIRDTLHCASGSLFHAAVRAGNLDIVKQVADIFTGLALPLDTAESITGLTPLHIAVRWLSTKSSPIQWFSKDKSLKKRKQDKRAGLKDSNKRSGDVYGKRNDSNMEYDTSIVEFLLSKGASVNTVDKNGMTPLHEAAVIGYGPLVRMLLDYGADPSLVDNKQYIPWMYAIVFHRTSIISLLDERSDVTVCQTGGRSILHLACASGCLQSIKALLSKGMHLQSVSDEGLTPLMEAVRSQHLNCVLYLLEQESCDVNQVNNDTSALTVALQQLNKFNMHGHKVLTALKQAGADLNQRDSNRNTPLLSYFDNVYVRTWLMENGADVNILGKDFTSCIWIAANKSGQCATDAVTQLMNFNVDMRLADQVIVEDGVERTAFQCALMSRNVELCTLFINAGCRGHKLKTWLQSDSSKAFLSNMDDSMKLVIDRIERHVSKTRRLEDICRHAVLGSLGSTDVQSNIDGLPLPHLLKIQMKWPVYLKWKESCYKEGVDT